MSEPFPPMPEGWNKTQADLVAEMRRGERGPLSSEERFWGRQYERVLVRASIPQGWNKTIADLVAEFRRGERLSVGSPESDWAWEYERSLIPPEMRFPREGDVYEVLEDMQVRYMTSWRAPFTGGGEGLLRKGDQLQVDQAPSEPDSIGAYVIALDYNELERRMVPEADRERPKYGGFYFHFKTVELNTKFRLVHEE